ncbi:MAG: hypothetical protein A2087_09920 [Spirochaetes bacterium GWD1_61_31]|nr:MAG: hypothetical protein A2Y37_07215 [Spirochaetes bacterium GWB1_60_80]OHD34009.1 MAG: hypothetical protein A2004_02145 [Spirochaetes bacterium GWC1_61_12]OHD41389.1 MAG: hypothetical protein A2Y35_05460 [Spirochaetes bacterium GWE1_60_18]OHD41552.1 MAG: hypothetical protein A2087_09920 [Spirochaetes bacterium GWD1_61_31]OHD59186.1 MAG: hypothetical protein A2Y32_00175 [Spirochaetes bacterium GWF1_60_12]HAP43979.1 lysis protein [Spirochaetaceae bacterium]
MVERKPDAQATRLTELESRFAWQERTIADLGGQIFGHERRLARLEELLRQLAGRLKELDDTKPGASLPQERPPHY